MYLLTEDGSPLLTEGDEPIAAYHALRDVVLWAARDALAAAFPDIPVSTARRAAVDQSDEFPRLVVMPGSAFPDDTQSPGETFWRFNFVVQGYAAGTDDDAAEYAQGEMHARVVAALQTAELGVATIMATTAAGDFGLYDADESAAPAGQFSVGFEALAVAPTNYPFVA